MKKTLLTKLTSHSTFFGIVGLSLLTILLSNYPKPEKNLAIGKRATQSSNYSNHSGQASKAIDGNTNGRWQSNSVTHTKGGQGEDNPWWSVDLGEVHEISKIQIWNRTDCCQQRIDNIRILIKEKPRDSWKGFTQKNHRYQMGESYPLSFNAKGKKYARYIMVQRMATNAILSLAEVKVFGKPLQKLPTANTNDVELSVKVSYTRARQVGTPNNCKNAIKDPIDGGTCWTCPAGYKRTVFSVKSGKACERPAQEVFAKAKRHGKGKGLLGTDCNGGQFWDPNGYCYSCPSGYNRTAHPVSSAKACSQRVHSDYTSARKIGNSGCDRGFHDLISDRCWECPKGYKRSVYDIYGEKACEKIKVK